MKTKLYIFIFSIFTLNCFAQNNELAKDSFPHFGNEHKNSAFFRERYLNNDLVHYLDNANDFVTYQSETTGQFNLPETMIFSISGNSFKWNKYYLDGFRVDSRFAPGSTSYQADLYSHALNINYFNSGLNFYTDSIIDNSVGLKYNIGGLGGISSSTQQLINMFHKTASERMYKTIEYRSQMKAAGNIALNYAIPIKGKIYKQQFSADFGTRMLLDFDETGISNYYPENFFKAQINGELALNLGSLLDNTNYIFNVSQRDNLYSEFYYGKNETAKSKALNFSVYGSKSTQKSKLTTGITFANNNITHNNLNFGRNLIDQDGEAFEPWYPDGNTNEISHALNYTKNINSNMQINFDAYNSLINFNPSQSSFQNTIYARNVNLPYQSLYVYNWNSNAFTSGILENTLGINTHKMLGKKLQMKANFNITFDGMLLTDKSMLRANWEAQLGFKLKPAKWFAMELNLSRNRVSFNMDDIRYFSNDYMNADIYYWKDDNSDLAFQQNEQSDYFTSTGGKYHTAVNNLKQASYFTLDLPFYFKFGGHEISLLNTYKKYNNFWTTKFDKEADEYGHYESIDDKQIYFRDNGAVNYLVDYYPESIMKTDGPLNFLSNSPFYFSSVIKYQYSNEKLLLSLSWTSYIMGGMSTLGNGPLHNNIGVYSETSANPNINYKLLGRLDQERAYVCRILLSYKLSPNFSSSLTGKFKDGQAFTNFATATNTDSNGNSQLAMWAKRTKGINPFTGDFGSREDACFNIDFNANYKGCVFNHNYEIQATIYNLYDFGTELTEYNFQPDATGSRYAMSLDIPRGLMLTAKFYY